MAIFYPSLEKISMFKVPATVGEWTLLEFLKNCLDDSFEVYFNPFLNGDRPDVLIMRKGYGVMIIEVKDWNLNNFRLNEKKKWIFIQNGSVVKSPIDQVLKYKNNLYDLHVTDLLQMKIKDYRHFNIVACAVYFHCASQHELEDRLIKPYKDDKKYQTFIKYNMDFIGKDGLNEEDFINLLKKRRIIASSPSWLFTDVIYENFKRLLSPAEHLKAEGEPYRYSDKQKSIIYSTNLEQRVRGVFGSGKTTVLAARAVQAYKRALSRNNTPRILILTFNITLKNFIHDKLNRVDETFPLDSFIIINYHQFINAELNNLNIEMEIPESMDKAHISDYLERMYYGNVQLFYEHKNQIVKYDAVLIDEIQDYHRSWMEIIKNFFRDPKGDYVLFGDVKQNIYGQPTLQKDVVTNVRGVNELKYCFRSDFKVRDLAQSFQQNVFGDKYDTDDFSENGSYDFFGQQQQKEGYINYMYLQDKNNIASLYTIIRGNILNKAGNISPNDITILGYTTGLLRTFLFTIYDLYVSFPDTFKERLIEECEKCRISFDVLIAFRKHYEEVLTQFKKEVYSSNYKNIRDNKKLHFWMNSGTIKISTINSFKGWESEVVFLVLEPKYDKSTTFNLSFDELLYTGITRCKRNLIVINFGNEEYDIKIRPLIAKLK